MDIQTDDRCTVRRTYRQTDLNRVASLLKIVAYFNRAGQSDIQTVRQIDRQMERQMNRQVDRQTDRKIDRKTDRKTYRRTDKRSVRRTYSRTDIK